MALTEGPVCRLCFATEGSALEPIFSSLKTHLPFLNTLARISLDEEKPQSICSNCEYQIETARLLRKRVQFTEKVWDKYKESIPEDPSTEDVVVCDPDILLNCHVCSHSSHYEGLQTHILEQHSQDHATECELCIALLGRRYPSNIKTEYSSTIVPEIEEVFLNSEGPSEESDEEEEIASQTTTTKDSREKPGFQCTLCKYCPKRWDNLLRHYRIRHPGEPLPHKPTPGESAEVNREEHICTVCGVKLSWLRSLRRHMKAKHPESQLNHKSNCKGARKLAEDRSVADSNSNEFEDLETGDDDTEIDGIYLKQIKCEDIKREDSIPNQVEPDKQVILQQPTQSSKRYRVIQVDDLQLKVELVELDYNRVGHICPVCMKPMARLDGLKRHIRLRHKTTLQRKQPLLEEGLIVGDDPGAESSSGSRSTVVDGSFFVVRPVSMENQSSIKKHYTCPICRTMIRGEKSFKQHLNNRHKDITFIFQDPFAEPEPESVQADMAENLEGKRVYKQVNIQMEREPQVFRVKQWSDKSIIECKLCHAKVSRFDGLKRHMQTLHQERTCFRCLTVFVDEQQMQDHNEEFATLGGPEGSDRYPCDKCGVKLNSFCQQEKHSYTHIKRFCSWCDFSCASFKEWRKHSEVHSVRKGPGNQCKSCDATFEDARVLKSHIETMHPKQKTLCAICGLYVTGMKRHMERHRKLRPYKCMHPGCLKSFSTRELLKVHRPIHSNVRPFACSIGNCTMRFRMKRTLLAHIVTHGEEKRFKCLFEDCDRAFHQRFDLNLHMRRHTGEKPFSCSGCEENFYTNSLLRKHQQGCTYYDLEESGPSSVMY